METVKQTLQDAVTLHQSGDLQQAEALYRKIIRVDPEHAGALHLLGVAAHQQQRPAEAVKLLSQAVALCGSEPLYHSNRGAAYRDLGDLVQAVGCFETAIALAPEFAGARYNLALALQRQNKLDEAMAAYRETLRIDPQFVQAWNNLGLLEEAFGKCDEAQSCFQAALEGDPTFLAARYNLGNSLAASGVYEAAVAEFERILQQQPDLAEAHNSLGTAQKELGQYEEAEHSFRRAIEFDPSIAEAHNNLGAVLEFYGDHEGALACYETAVQEDPGFAGARSNRANVLCDMGMTDDALAEYSRALAIAPESAEARFNRGLALLRTGDYSSGWPEYEWRWNRKVRPRHFDPPVWDGSPLSGKSLLVYAEQGIGDEVMFASCLPEIIASCSRCVVECDPRLLPLFARSFPEACIVPRPLNWAESTEEKSYDVEFQTAMGSLPRFLRRNLSEFPRAESYLVTDPDQVSHWTNRYRELGDRLKVGISWRGGEEPHLKRRRSTSLHDWKDILALPGADFVCLQYDSTYDELDDFRKRTGLAIHDWEDAQRRSDLDGLAAQIAALDLVISVDNSTAHFAGALGTEAWTILPFAADWRWLLEADDTPWYASMRLFRQDTAGEWGAVIKKVASALRVRGAARPVESNSVLNGESLKRRDPKLSPFLRSSSNVTSERPSGDAVALPRQELADTDADPSCDSKLTDRPEQIAADFSVGNRHQQCGEFDVATNCYQRVLDAQPNHVGAWLNLGNVHLSQEDLDQARVCFDRVLQIEPGYSAAVHTNLAIGFIQSGRLTEAEELVRIAGNEDPGYAEAHYVLGNVLAERMQLDESVAAYLRAIDICPEHAEALNSLGNVFRQQHRYEEAETCFRAALRNQPGHTGALVNWGVLLHEQDRLAEAIERYQQALTGSAPNPDTLTNLGIARIHQRRFDEALTQLGRAIELSPQHAEARFYRGIALLATGEFPAGWQDYEFRWKRGDLTVRHDRIPRWDGKPLAGRQLLVWGEQGLGDEILFASCLDDLLAEESRVTLECDPRLVSLFTRSFPQATVLPRAEGDTAAPVVCDVQLPLGSLPALYRKSFANFPQRTGFLKPDATRAKIWRDRYNRHGSGLKIGISWRGGAHHEDRRRRNIDLNEWASVVGFPRTCFVDLQYGTTSDEAEAFSALTGQPTSSCNSSNSSESIDEFAARVAALDLVISIDNTTVHVAGALGIPVWTLLPFTADWRWFDGRDDSPWYPSMRLFPQGKSGDWKGVMTRIAEALRERLGL